MNSTICRYGAPIRNRPTPIKLEYIKLAQRIPVRAGAIQEFASQCASFGIPVPSLELMEKLFVAELAHGIGFCDLYTMKMLEQRRALRPSQDPCPGIVAADWEEEL